MLLESARPDAFSQPDEHLLVVIASHLAGLIEYGRVREEAEGRARNLGLIHEVVQQVVGVVNKLEVAQITAFLLAQYFGYELTAVMLVDSTGKLNIRGFAGARAATVKKSLAGSDFQFEEGIIGHVFTSGQSILANDVTENPLYQPIKGWSAASEMCVALKDAGRTFGIIDIESSDKNAFNNNDLLALESLAGILATVVASADQYQRMQEVIRQHKMTQMELKARMDAQQAAESRLVQAAKLAAVGEMAAGIAHELNNPLTTVTGFAELILDDASESSIFHDELGMILREAKRARDVVRRLLDFSRQSEQTRTRADLNEVLSDVIALTQHLIRTNGVQLSVEMANDLPWVYVDRNHMKQVMLNLIHNALQAMPEGGKLEITTAQKNRDGKSWVTIAVRDTGVGINPKDRERIFEPFFTTKGDKGGTGLGLSVTYGIVTDHSGQIDVESVPGQGACFTVWLPIQEFTG
jgi:signal transduction histidine kinase